VLLKTSGVNQMGLIPQMPANMSQVDPIKVSNELSSEVCPIRHILPCGVFFRGGLS
jgi:hypothetical protein